eukprot:TRINITY_DN16260_c0_g1_i1.p1 TRINITY_DN16260_c0_g1~~TRINITY_DN16260_c0_g1_i1.p1  ORF type:complete len:387 (+),score=63.05 TRINITY_DN16260_c0_g1_i1:30-1163(+)
MQSALAAAATSPESEADGGGGGRQWLVRARGVGEWRSDCGTRRGAFRLYIDTDLADLVVHNGPENLEEGNPVSLASRSFVYLDGGSSLRVCFSFRPFYCEGHVVLTSDGCMTGTWVAVDGKGEYTGHVDGEYRPKGTRAPRCPKALTERLKKEPRSVSWEVPASISEGRVALVGIGGASRSGKGTVSNAVAEVLRNQGFRVAIVGLDRFCNCVGSYQLPEGGTEGMYETPCSIDWPRFARALTASAQEVDATSKKQPVGVVITEGFLLYWMAEFNRAFTSRIFLRTSREEVFRRRQRSTKLAESFLEHVFWPSHLAFGQPQAPVDEIFIEDNQQAYPVPDSLLSEVLKALPFLTARPQTKASSHFAGADDPTSTVLN